MAHRILTWFREMAMRRAAIEAANDRFDSSKGEGVIRYRGTVIGRTSDSFVVRVEHGDGNIKPPGRPWYIVRIDGPAIDSITFEQAQQYGERRWVIRSMAHGGDGARPNHRSLVSS
jgi:hypothetical protein